MKTMPVMMMMMMTIKVLMIDGHDHDGYGNDQDDDNDDDHHHDSDNDIDAADDNGDVDTVFASNRMKLYFIIQITPCILHKHNYILCKFHV